MFSLGKIHTHYPSQKNPLFFFPFFFETTHFLPSLWKTACKALLLATHLSRLSALTFSTKYTGSSLWFELAVDGDKPPKRLAFFLFLLLAAKAFTAALMMALSPKTTCSFWHFWTNEHIAQGPQGLSSGTKSVTPSSAPRMTPHHPSFKEMKATHY